MRWTFSLQFHLHHIHGNTNVNEEINHTPYQDNHTRFFLSSSHSHHRRRRPPPPAQMMNSKIKMKNNMLFFLFLLDFFSFIFFLCRFSFTFSCTFSHLEIEKWSWLKGYFLLRRTLLYILIKWDRKGVQLYYLSWLIGTGSTFKKFRILSRCSNFCDFGNDWEIKEE